MKKLEIQGLKKKYNGKWVIKGIDLTINEKNAWHLSGLMVQGSQP